MYMCVQYVCIYSCMIHLLLTINRTLSQTKLTRPKSEATGWSREWSAAGHDRSKASMATPWLPCQRKHKKALAPLGERVGWRGFGVEAWAGTWVRSEPEIFGHRGHSTLSPWFFFIVNTKTRLGSVPPVSLTLKKNWRWSKLTSKTEAKRLETRTSVAPPVRPNYPWTHSYPKTAKWRTCCCLNRHR